MTSRSDFAPPEPTSVATLRKAPTGIKGLDEITGGGFPVGRTTLICGTAGCGKTLLASEFLIHGVTQYDEPGVFIAFEETEEDLTKNVASLGFDLEDLKAQGKIYVDHISIDRSEIEEVGEYDLEGLFLRIGLAIDCVGAKRIVLDTLETLFAGLDNPAVLRAELRRLFYWLKERGITAVITGERGEGALTRQGLEEYVSDCVILLDHRVHDQISTRRLRIVKYRGTSHGTNEYPFLIDEDGISVLPLTALGLDHAVSEERISSGVPRLDEMLGGKGYYRGSSILVSGTAGTGKTSLIVHLVHATCARGERALYFSFEESQNQIVRNARSIGIDLQPSIDAGLLKIHSSRPTSLGLESHLAILHKMIRQHGPSVVAIDPISHFMAVGSFQDTQSMLVRLVDFLKGEGITAFLTTLTSGGAHTEVTDVGISSIVDTWLLLRDIELGGERNRGLYILKSRGMAHSNQIREFLLTSHGIELRDVYTGQEGVLTGSMRIAQEAREKAAADQRRQEEERRRREAEHQKRALMAQIAVLQGQLDSILEDNLAADRYNREKQSAVENARTNMARSRKADESDDSLTAGEDQ